MKAGSFFCILCVFIGGQTVFQVGISLLELLLNAFGYTIAEGLESLQTDPNNVSMFLYAGFLAPVAEEMLYRGLIFRELSQTSKAAAYLVSMAAFAAIHVLGYIGSEDLGRLVLCFIQYLPAGLCLAWTYTKADNIVAPIVVHAIVNAVAIGALR